ncbi:MAG: hypothetical protein ACRDI3_01365, partial [Actinomycetota bacterium]
MGESHREVAAALGARVGRSRFTPRRLRPRKILVSLLSAAVLAGPFTPVGRTAPSGIPFCDVPGQITPHIPEETMNELVARGIRIPAWYSIKMPSFSVGPQLALDYAA